MQERCRRPADTLLPRAHALCDLRTPRELAVEPRGRSIKGAVCAQGSLPPKLLRSLTHTTLLFCLDQPQPQHNMLSSLLLSLAVAATRVLADSPLRSESSSGILIVDPTEDPSSSAFLEIDPTENPSSVTPEVDPTESGSASAQVTEVGVGKNGESSAGPQVTEVGIGKNGAGSESAPNPQVTEVGIGKNGASQDAGQVLATDGASSSAQPSGGSSKGGASASPPSSADSSGSPKSVSLKGTPSATDSGTLGGKASAHPSASGKSSASTIGFRFPLVVGAALAAVAL